MLQDALSEPLALLGTELRGRHRARENLQHVLRKTARSRWATRGAHVPSRIARNCTRARRRWLLTVPSGSRVAAAIS